MLLNAASLAGLTTSFRMDFNTGFNSANTYYDQIATRVPSITDQNQYAWLGQVPGIREWVGDREIHKLEQHDYAIKNKTWESTIAVKRESIMDDQYGVYTPLMANMGFETARFPDELIFGALNDGFATNGYDGQFFFDTDHPGFDANGAATTVSNDGGGAGNPWFLLDTRRPLRPLIYQEREMFSFTAMDRMDDENVFMRKEYLYGVSGRMNVGYGFWQQAYGSKDTLNATNFNAAIAAMMGIKKRSGKPMGIRPNLLVCGPANRAAAYTLLNAEQVSDGTTTVSNINRNAVELLVVEWLS